MTDPARVTAYENALRGIAAAAIAARRRPYDREVLQSMLCDVEHHLSSLIVLGYIPPNEGPVTVSGRSLHDDPPLHRLCSCRDTTHRADQCPRELD